MEHIHTIQDLYDTIPERFMDDITNNTLHYMTTHFKKCVIVCISGKKLCKCIHFNNTTYMNDWSYTLPIQEQTEMLKAFQDSGATQPVLGFAYANNYLIRCEHPFVEHLHKLEPILQWAHDIAEHIEKPTTMIINRRDFPIVRSDGKHPYTNLFPINQVPTIRDISVPIRVYGFSTTDGYEDILVPNPEDMKCKVLVDVKQWNTRINKALFCGGITGALGDTLEESVNINQRLATCILPPTLYMDRFITKQIRKRKSISSNKIVGGDLKQYIHRDLFSLPLSLNEMAEYRFHVCLDGHVAPYRILTLMKLGVVCIIPYPFKWSLWYYDQLAPNHHFVPWDTATSLYQLVINCCNDEERMNIISYTSQEFVTNLSYPVSNIQPNSKPIPPTKPIPDPTVQKLLSSNSYKYNELMEYYTTHTEKVCEVHPSNIIQFIRILKRL